MAAIFVLGWPATGSDVFALMLSSQPSFTSSSVTSGSCSSTSDSVTMTTWNTSEPPQCRTAPLSLTGSSSLANHVCRSQLQAETRSTTTPGVNPPLTSIAMATRATQIHGNESASSTT